MPNLEKNIIGEVFGIIDSVVGTDLMRAHAIRKGRARAIEESTYQTHVLKQKIGGEIGVLERLRQRKLMEAAIEEDNINAAAEEAEKFIEDDAKPEQVEADFFARWSKTTGKVSRGDAQRMFGRLLAGEVNQPGSVSLQTLEILSMMSSKDAHALKMLSAWCFEFGNRPIPLGLLAGNLELGNAVGNYELESLASLGLIKISDLGTRSINFNITVADQPYALLIHVKKQPFRIHNQAGIFPGRTGPHSLKATRVLLTRPGEEIISFMLPKEIPALPIELTKPTNDRDWWVVPGL